MVSFFLEQLLLRYPFCIFFVGLSTYLSIYLSIEGFYAMEEGQTVALLIGERE
jgi:hypothetical protein